MNILNRKQRQRGVGLIEVLIALVVIAVGVIAVLGLQGTLMSGSATTKARNEAMALARKKTEELRNAIALAQFDTELEAPVDPDEPIYDPDYKDGIKVDDGSGNGEINGLNALFTRSWKIVDIDADGDGDATNDSLKELIMQVTWENAQGVDTLVELNTLIAYTSPLTSALSQLEHSASIPGETDTGYEGRHPDTPDNPDPEADDYEVPDDVSTLADDGYPVITDVLRYSNGHVQVRTLYDEDNCALADKVTEGDTDYCVVFTAFGGTLLRFNGTVHLDLKDSTVKDIEALVKATSPAYCAMKLQETCGSLKCMKYQCYASGDCSIRDGNGDGDGHGGGVDDCPDTLTDLPDLNGGWRGRVGHFFYDNKAPYQAPPNVKVCMGKRREGGVLKDNEAISRSYHGLRKDDSGNWWREGINQSYSCHNTLFVKYSQKEDICDYGYDEMISEGIVWNSFKEQEVVRYFDPDTDPDTDLDPGPGVKWNEGDVDNIVMDPDTSYCDLVAIYGEILDSDIVFSDKVIAEPVNNGLLNLKSEPDPGFEAGECVTHGDLYACNFIDEPPLATGTYKWSGTISATRLYTVTDKTISPPDIFNAEFICKLTYEELEGRLPKQDLTPDTCLPK